MENISNLLTSAIISTGFLLYRPQDFELLVYGFVVILIAYVVIYRLLKKYNLHNYFSIISLSITSYLGIVYITKQGFFLIIGFVYLLYSSYYFVENLKEYTNVGESISH